MASPGDAAPDSRGPAGLRSALRSPSFAVLFLGYAVSAVGSGMSAVAISWLAIRIAHGHDTGLLVGAAVAAYTLPGVVVGLGLGRLLARFDPRLLVLADAALRATCLGGIAVIASIGLLAPGWYVALLGVASLFGLLGVAGDLATVPELLPPAQHVAGNSLITVASFAGIILGPALAGLLIAVTSPAVAIGADGASYVVLVLAVVVSRRVRAPKPRTGEIQSVGRALRMLSHQPAVLGITILCVVFFGLYGPVEVALPVFVSQTLHAGPGVLGGYWTLFAIGATVGALGASWTLRFGLWRVALVVMAGWGICLVPFGFVHSVIVGFIALAVGGLVYGPFLPLKTTIIQRHSPPRSLTAIAAASGVLTVPAAPIGTALGGPIVAAIGPGSTLLVSGLATVAAASVGATALIVHRSRKGTKLSA
ncbi:MAG: MFS transporter [Candidatus Dormiibacterota bacterium]